MIERKGERQPVVPLDTGESAEQRGLDSTTPAELLVHFAEEIRNRANDPEFQRQELKGISTDEELREFVDRRIVMVAHSLEQMASAKRTAAYHIEWITDSLDIARATQEVVELQMTMMRMGIKPVENHWQLYGLSTSGSNLLRTLINEASGWKSKIDYTSKQGFDYVTAVEELRESGALQDGDPPKLKFDLHR